MVMATSIKNENRKSYKLLALSVFIYAVISVITFNGRHGNESSYIDNVISYKTICMNFIRTMNTQILVEYVAEYAK